MRRILLLIILFSITGMIEGCNSSSTSTPSTVTITPTPTTPTTTPLPAPAIQPTATTPPLPKVTCNELSLYLDPILATRFACETVAEVSTSDIPVNYPFIYPGHTELTIQDYPLTDTQFPPGIWVYPLSRYSELLPDIVPPRLSELKNVLAGNPLVSKEMPYLPPIPQIQAFHLHEALLSFQGGEGLRYITVYSGGPHLITNRNIHYTFQGLTDDGKYWVAVTLPISNPVLPDDYDAFPEGYTQESLIADFDAYVSDVESQLKAQFSGSFFPTIDSLDELIESIIVN